MGCTCKGQNRSGTAQLCEPCARETQPPTAADAEAADFEAAISERGEYRACLDRLLSLLEAREGEAT